MALRTSPTSHPSSFLHAALAKRYDRAAQNWHRSLSKNGYLAAYTDLISQARPHLPIQDFSVLDVGTGTGGFALCLRATLGHAKTLVLSDISNEMLNAATQNLRLANQTSEQLCAPLENLHTQPKRFDIVLCAHVIEHCADPSQALKSLRQLLAPNGVLLIIVSKPHWCTYVLRLIWRHKSFSEDAFKRMLRSAGLQRLDTVRFQCGPPKFTSHAFVARAQPHTPSTKETKL